MNPRKATMAAHAVGYAKRGLYVFPTPPGERCSYLSGASNGNRWGCSNDPNIVRQFFERFPAAGIGIATGPESGVFVLDIDTIEAHDKDGIASLQRLQAEHGELPATMTAQTPSSGTHYYFKYPKDATIKNSTSGLADGLDVRGVGGMVIAPPSKTSEGVYHLVRNCDPVEAPQWLVDAAVAANGANGAGDAGNAGEDHEAGDEPQADPALIAAALAQVPNNDLDWENRNRVAMACWRATGGSDEGFRGFDVWSAKSEKKYVASETRARWDAISRCPPSIITAATIFYLADQASPGWRDKIKPTTPVIRATPFVWIDPKKIPRRRWLYRPHYVRQFLSATVSTSKIIASHCRGASDGQRQAAAADQARATVSVLVLERRRPKGRT